MREHWRKEEWREHWREDGWRDDGWREHWREEWREEGWREPGDLRVPLYVVCLWCRIVVNSRGPCARNKKTRPQTNKKKTEKKHSKTK